MKPKFLLLAELDPDALAELRNYYDVTQHERYKDQAICEDDLIAILDALKPTVMALEAQPLTDKVLSAAAPYLKAITSVRTTPANIDLAAAKRLGIQVSSAPGRNAMAVVEMAVGLMLACARMIPQAYMDVKNRGITIPPGTPRNETGKDVVWHSPVITVPAYYKYCGLEISGKTLGLVGLGAIAKMLVPKARAFDMRVLAYDPYVSEAAAAELGVEMRDLDGVLSDADFVSLHAKVTPETVNIMNLERFGKMKKSAYLINTARGALVNERDLMRALSEGMIAGAALDVFEFEPLYSDSPLLDLDNLIVTPHIGGASKDVIRHQSRLVLNNAIAFAEGKPLPNQAG